MPFIGKQPEVGAYQLIDSITTSATATYALTVDGSAYFPASARNLIVSLNGVTQAPESAYTVSGSNIVFDSALTASDVIDYILVIGDAVDIGTPSDGTVGTSQMSYPLGNFSSTGIDDNATSTAITIDASQNVGIGKAPDSGVRLNIEDSTPILRLDSTSDTGQCLIHFGDPSSNFAGVIAYENDGDRMQFYTDQNPRLTIDSGGNVGIGTASPSAALHLRNNDYLKVIVQDVAGTATPFSIGSGANGFTIANNTNANTSDEAITLNSNIQSALFYTAGSERARLDASGNLLVGTTSSALVDSGCRLNAAGRLSAICPTANSAGLFGRSNDGPLLVFYIGGTSVGNIQHTSGTVAIAQASDERLKQNISEISGCLDEIKQIRPVSWDWNSREGGSIGVVAQEIQQIWPDVVDEGDDGYLTVAGISRVEARLIKAIQEQQAMIETLQAQVAELQGAN